MTESSRDVRRRRIAERGSDRLALITGLIKTIPPEFSPRKKSTPESDSDMSRGHSYTVSCPPSISQIDFPSFNQPSESLDPLASESKASGSFLRNQDSLHENDQQLVSGGRIEPYMRKCESSTEVSRGSAFDLLVKRQSAQVRSNRPVSTTDSDHHRIEPLPQNKKIVTLNQLTSAIGATQSVRTYCSLALAIFVFSSYIGFPMIGSHIFKSVISFGPLYLLLLSNITIVLAHLFEKQRASQKPGQQITTVPSVGDGSLPDQIGNALELGLMLQKIISALFMDCSIYAITVICTLSLGKRLGC